MAVDLVELATQRRLSITAAARDENSIIAAQEAQAAANAQKEKLKQANAKALASNTTFAGFSVKDVSAFFGGMSPAATEALLVQANGGRLSQEQSEILSTVNPKLYKSDFIPGLTHLAEHPKGSHYKGDLNKVLSNPLVRVVAGALTAGYSEYGVAGLRATQGDFRAAAITAVGATVAGTGATGSVVSGGLGVTLDNTFARSIGYKTPSVTVSNETEIASQAAQEERRRRALLNNQNRLIKTTPLGARISGNQLGGQNTFTGGY